MLLAGRRLLVVDENEDLARLVATAAIAKGGNVLPCSCGRDALARADAGDVDAVIVDLPLADMRGDVFLVALRDRDIPCVAVSGVLRGESYAELARHFGAMAYFETPFPVEAALSALAQAWPAPAAGDPLPDPDPLPTTPAEEDATPHPLGSDAIDPSLDPESLIYCSARPALDETLPGVPLTRPAAHGLDLPLPSTTPAPIALRRERPELPEGSLGVTTAPRLLVALHAAQVTGALVVSRGAVKKVMLLDAGRVVLATSNVASERFGARCVRAGVLTAADHDQLASELAPSQSLGAALVARGMLEERERARLIAEQVRDIVWSTFAWRDGTYRLKCGALSVKPRVPLSLSAGDLVLDGYRKLGALEQLREELPGGLALAPRSDAALQPDELTMGPAEASLLAAADGTKTVRDLVLLAQLDERSALAFLQGCRDLGLLDDVSRVLAGTRRIGFM